MEFRALVTGLTAPATAAPDPERVTEDRLYHRDPESRPLPQAPARGLGYALLLGAAGWVVIWGAVVLIRAWIA